MPSTPATAPSRADLLLGYSVFRNDDPRGQFYCWRTMRAMLAHADGTRRSEAAPALIDAPDVWTQFAGWSPDGKLAIIARAWESEENYKWERANSTFRMTEGWLLDSCLVDLETRKAENVTGVDRVSAYNSGLFFWPGDPNRLGFQALIDSVSHPYSMDRDGKNKKDLTAGKAEFTYGFSASPDGKRIAYHKNYQVYVANADGTNAVRVDTGHPFHFCPTWSFDGQWLLFLDGEHYKCHPAVVAADGSNFRKLADRGGYRGVTECLVHPDFHSASSDVPVWTPDNRWIYYTARVGNAIELMRIALAPDAKPEQLSHSKPDVTHYHPKISPDGNWVMFGSDRDGRRQLYVARADGSEAAQFTDVPEGHSAMHGHWRGGRD
ncbi:MAG: hypothetical protein NTW19_13665 [Planctomycetota bacterium]|nr:hypothetical protein [Planctomycetota bacterium]